MCSVQAVQLLQDGLPGPTPASLATLCSACSRLKIHEVRLYEAVLAHVADHWYDYPAASLAAIGAAVTSVLPCEPEPIQEVYGSMLDMIQADSDRLSLESVASAAHFLAELQRCQRFLEDPSRALAFVLTDRLPSFSRALARRVVELKDESKERYDVALVVEVLSTQCPDNRLVFSVLCRHLHRHLGIFEPVDFVRFTRGLSATDYRDDRVVHALSKWATKRAAEFSTFDWDAFLNSLEKLGAREDRLTELRSIAPAKTQRHHSKAKGQAASSASATEDLHGLRDNGGSATVAAA